MKFFLILLFLLQSILSANTNLQKLTLIKQPVASDDEFEDEEGSEEEQENEEIEENA